MALFFLFFSLFWKEPFSLTDLLPIETTLEEEIPEDVRVSLSQSFSFLGAGSQVSAFSSEDGTIVLKLFKGTHKKKWKLRRFFHSFSKDQTHSHATWNRKFTAACSSYDLAFSHFRDESGLIYLHFDVTPTPLLVEIKGKQSYWLDLSSQAFIIQKRGVLAPTYFQSLKTPSEIEVAKQALLHFFRLRTEKGLSDPRQTLGINYGFINGKPIQIDCGKLELFSGDVEEEINRISEGVSKNLDALFSGSQRH